MKNFKKILIAAFAAILLVVSGAYLVALAKPTKITDPHDPAFNIEKFDSRDYKSADEIAEVFRKFFPLGTKRSYIDHILVENGGIRIIREGLFKEREEIPGLGHGYNHQEAVKGIKAEYFISYNLLAKKPLFRITPGSSRGATAYYDENDNLKILFVGGELVHSKE